MINIEKKLRKDFRPLDWNNFGSTIVDDLISEGNKYGLKFDFDKVACDEIIKKVVENEKIQFSAICGGFFTRHKDQDRKQQSVDIFIYDCQKHFITNEKHLNSFLKEPFKKIDFDDLGKISPSGIVAKKHFELENGQKVNVYFTHIAFPLNDSFKYELLDLFDLNPCKIMYYAGNKQFYLNNWFSIGGHIVPENKNPSHEFLSKYRRKGFNFEGDYFMPKSII
ncbi:unnamed protein product [Brachionus calyciflorus]|uniref:Uncharacterized protein n=1 Tax=Brachionus calyciflorus TaxID=104777 RepID=A0A814EMF9_9BILA|nr:unnamed protein product [Brachionus calyciflorus]